MAGREKILAQNPYRPPTRKTKNTPQPRFHGEDPDVKKDFMAGLRAFLAQFAEAFPLYYILNICARNMPCTAPERWGRFLAHGTPPG